MPTRTFATAGINNLWSNSANWDTGVPANTDTAIIPVGQTVEFDVSQSGFAAGITLTLNGVFTASLTAGTYYLKLQDNVTGTGTFRAGTEAVPYPTTCLFTIYFAAGKAFTGSLVMDINCTEPTHRYIKLSQAEIAGATLLHVDDDVVGDLWAVGNVIHIDNINKAQQSEERTIAAGGITATTITITAGLTAAKLLGAKVILLNRNIIITGALSTPFNAVTTAGRVFAYVRSYMGFTSCSNLVIGGVLAYSGSSFGIVMCSYITFIGVATGLLSFAQYSQYCTFNGFYSGCYDTFNNIWQGCTIGGLISGARSGLNGAQPDIKITATIEYSQYGIITLSGGLFTGTIRYGSYGIYPQEGISDIVISGTISYCTTGIRNGTNLRIINANILNNTTGMVGGNGIIVDTIFSGNTYDFSLDEGGSWKLYNTPLPVVNRSAPKYSENSFSFIESFNDTVEGNYKAWSRNGPTISVNDPVPDGFVRAYKTTLLEANYCAFWQREVLVPANATISFVMWIRKSVSMLYNPRWWIFPESMEPFYSGTPLKEFIFPDDDNDVWEQDTYVYTNTSNYDKTLIARCIGKNASGDIFSQLIITSSMAPRSRGLGGVG
jgi:hypothetical protein